MGTLRGLLLVVCRVHSAVLLATDLLPDIQPLGSWCWIQYNAHTIQGCIKTNIRGMDKGAVHEPLTLRPLQLLRGVEVQSDITPEAL